MIKTSEIKLGSFLRFNESCDEYSHREYDGFLNCNLKVIRIKFYQQGVVSLKLSKTTGEEIVLALDIHTASKWFSPGVK